MATREDFERRVLEHLTTLLRGRGTPQAAFAKALGVSPSQITHRFNGNVRFTAGELWAVLDTMGVEPAEFFAGAAGGFHAEVYLARLEQRNPRQVKYVKSDLLRDPPLNPYGPDELRRIAAGLEELRLLDANAARTQALAVLGTLRHTAATADPRSECETHVALGAIYRARGRYGSAAFFLRQALLVAGSDGPLVARTLQAVASLARDQGDFEEAFAAVRRAVTECIAAGDWSGVGRALITQGILAGFTGDLSEAVDALRQGLALVSDDEWYDRFAALQNLGLSHVYRGEVEEALESSELALTVLDTSAAEAPLQKSAALWLRGEIFLLMDLPEKAARDLCGVLEIYLIKSSRPLDLALVAIRLAHALLGQPQLLPEPPTTPGRRFGRSASRPPCGRVAPAAPALTGRSLPERRNFIGPILAQSLRIRPLDGLWRAQRVAPRTSLTAETPAHRCPARERSRANPS